MNATIRAHHLGLALPTETARQFSIKVIISLTVVSMATASLIYDEIYFDQSKNSKSISKTKIRRVRRKILSLFAS
jgi:hypothetical protein